MWFCTGDSKFTGKGRREYREKTKDIFILLQNEYKHLFQKKQNERAET